MTRTLTRAGWMIAPVVIAGFGHVVVLKTHLFQSLAMPLDAGIQVRGRPLFGANKTVRGLALMTALSALVTAGQAGLLRRFRWREPRNLYLDARTRPWIAGAICGASYSLAELPNSFAKRQIGIRPGRRSERAAGIQYLIDQADSVAGCLVPLRLIYRATGPELLVAASLGLGIHLGIDRLLYAIGVKAEFATA